MLNMDTNEVERTKNERFNAEGAAADHEVDHHHQLEGVNRALADLVLVQLRDSTRLRLKDIKFTYKKG